MFVALIVRGTVDTVRNREVVIIRDAVDLADAVRIADKQFKDPWDEDEEIEIEVKEVKEISGKPVESIFFIE